MVLSTTETVGDWQCVIKIHFNKAHSLHDHILCGPDTQSV